MLARVEQLHGKPLSYNNLNDLSAAPLLSREFDGPACVIVKHSNPCGVGVAATIEAAYEKALAADPVSAFGGVVVLTRPVTPRSASGSRSSSSRCSSPRATTRPRSRRSRRSRPCASSNDSERRAFDPPERDMKRVMGGLLVQERDVEPDPLDEMEVVCGAPRRPPRDDLLFAWTVVKHTLSNAIVIARDGQTLGIGAGQMSRVDSVRIAVEKAREHGQSLGRRARLRRVLPLRRRPRARPRGRHLRDHPARRLDARRRGRRGVRRGAAMVITGRRHFRH